MEKTGPSAPEALARAMDAHFTGPNGWNPGLLPLVSDLMPRDALWKPSPERHSIWEIVRHVAFWRRYWVASARGEEPPDVEAGSWSAPPEPADDAAWERELAELKGGHARLIEAMKRADEAKLLAEPDGYCGLWAHDAYHAGQIAYVRALRGLRRDYEYV